MKRSPMPPTARRLSLGCFVAAALLLAASWFPRSTAAAPVIDHIIVVVMENHSYDQVRTAPYTASLIAQSSSFSQSYALTHPSQPNYFTLWAASTEGTTNDVCPPPGSPYSGENLGHACEAAGLTWKAYSEDLPAAGSTVCTSGGGSPLYTRKHDPWVSYSNLTHTNEVPYSYLATDIANNTLPNLAFVVPNNCHNTHDCSVSTGDTWLSNNLPAMLSGVGPRGLVILTWDEDNSASGNHILTVFSGPTVLSNFVSSQLITHYTVVRTICDMLGLNPFNAALLESPITGAWSPIVTAVPHGAATGVTLGSARPNPSRGRISATLQLPSERRVEASIFDSAGRRVRRLVSGPLSGAVEIVWDGSREDGRGAAPGLYFLRVRAGGAPLETRLVRIR